MVPVQESLGSVLLLENILYWHARHRHYQKAECIYYYPQGSEEETVTMLGDNQHISENHTPYLFTPWTLTTLIRTYL